MGKEGIASEASDTKMNTKLLSHILLSLVRSSIFKIKHLDFSIRFDLLSPLGQTIVEAVIENLEQENKAKYILQNF